MSGISPISDLTERRKWFEDLVGYFKSRGFDTSFAFGDCSCPCCGYPELAERGGYEICGLCFWEDDDQDDHDADEVLGGPNGDYSLTECRENFSKHLTGYRPSDGIGFRRHTENNELKKKIIDSYWKFKPDMSKEDFDNKKKELIDLLKEFINLRKGTS